MLKQKKQTKQEKPLKKKSQDYPVYFELEGKYAAIDNAPDGGLHVTIPPGPYGIADFMEKGSPVKYEDLPEEAKVNLTGIKK